ncbi:MAG: DUF1566 domain-containing protein [Chitinophagales bacterium]|nr:DUF1566 domain-containing protein [Chitinophagales bacterium]
MRASLLLLFLGILLVSCEKEELSTCFDGIQNGDETAIDCGGSCMPCDFQASLDDGETPFDMYLSGISLKFIYGLNYEGGTIFYLDTINGSGFVTATEDQTTKLPWSNGSLIWSYALGEDIGTGLSNTNKIVAKQGPGEYAASICNDLSIGEFSDWFLPSKDELDLMYWNLKMNDLGGFTNNFYWSSTEDFEGDSWIQNFANGAQGSNFKEDLAFVRAVRSF